MTQKELCYIEDAVGHESNIINICQESMNMLENEDLIAFIKKEIKKHESIKYELMEMLEVKSNEWSSYNG